MKYSLDLMNIIRMHSQVQSIYFYFTHNIKVRTSLYWSLKCYLTEHPTHSCCGESRAIQPVTAWGNGREGDVDGKR